jgi:two-component system sensor kinase FixL
VVVGDIDSGRIVLWNPAAESMFGYAAAEALGQPIEILIPPAIARLHSEALALYRRTGHGAIVSSGRPIEVPAVTRSGDEIRVELSLVPVEGTPGGKRYVMAMLRDATDRKRAELQSLEITRERTARAEAESALEQRGELLTSGLSELSRPIARLSRSAARLARGAEALEPRRVAALAEVIQRRARLAQQTMQQLVDATAMRTDSIELQARRVNLVPIVTRVGASVRARSAAHKFKIGVPQGLTVQADAERIEQVLESLIEQAMRRNPRGCWIDIDLRRPLVGLARLEVRDYGRPVSEAEQRQLLESNGSHHGLAVSRWIVEQHGGTLTLEAPDEGGLRAIVTLPTQHGRVRPPAAH